MTRCVLTTSRVLEVGVGYVAARQRAIEPAIVIHDDCVELGIDPSPPRASHRGLATGVVCCIGSDLTTRKHAELL